MKADRKFHGWMWAEACEFITQAERLQGQFFRLSVAQQSAAVWEPPIDLFENEHEILIIVALPGVPAERVHVSYDAGVLIVRASRPSPMAGSGQRVTRLEIPYGNFERRIPLAQGRFELGEPELTHGCLMIRLTKLGTDMP